MDREFWNDEFARDAAHVDVADRFLGALVRDLEPVSALDLGCGSGGNTLMLAARGWAAVGVDWSERAIQLARRAARRQRLSATFIVADTRSWAPPRPFALVVSTYALPGGDESRHVLATAAAALAPGGTLLVADWDRSMAEVWPFEPETLATPGEIAGWLPGLDIGCAEVRRIDVFEPDDPRAFAGTCAAVAFVRARRPL